MIRVFLSRALDLVFRRRRDDRLSEEVQTHLDLLTEEHIAQGMTREAARAAARRAFGGVDGMKTTYREQRGLPAVDNLTQDVRYAVRLLVKDRRFTLAAIAALALAIGATTTAFTFVNAALLREMPLRDPDRLMVFVGKDPSGRLVGASYTDFKDWRDATRTFSQVIVSMELAVNLTDDGLAPERYWGSLVSVDAFKMLGQAPVLGRDFTAEDDRPDSPVAIIAHSLWKGRYGSDPAIIGRTIRVNERPLTVIGVMPPGFHFMTVVEVWRPSSTALPTTLNGKRDVRFPYIYAVGRLADDVTRTAAQAEIDTIVSRLAQQFPETNASTVVGLEPVQDVLLGALGQMFLLVMAAVLLVLLIACVNVANLLMARGVHRAREMALRLSLGATRWRVIRQLLIESLLLATLGGVCGFVLAFYGVRVFARTIDEMMASWQNPPDFYLDFSIDGRVYLFTLATCVATALLFGLLPALQVSRTNANEVLKEGGRSATPGIPARRWTAGLMASQLALTLVLLAGAAVVGRNFDAIYRAAHTTDTSGIVTMRLSLAAQKYPTANHIRTFYQRLDERLAAMPELAAVTVASDIPFVPTLSLSRQLLIDGRPWAPLEKPPTVSYLYTGPRYFETFRLPIRRGRALDDRDARQGQEGVVVNERFAALFFPASDVVGQRIQLANAARPDLVAPWYTIVGISATVPHAMRQEQEPVVYARVETEPVPNRFASIAARGTLDTAAIVARLRQEMAHVDPALPGYWVQTLDQVLASSRWVQRVFGLMLALLAVIALTLASVGLYAVTAHGVAQRAQEIGVRMALGADAPSIVRLFARRTLWQLAIGLALGGTLVLASGRFLQSWLAGLGPIEVSAHDPLTLASVAALLVSVAALACILPARRAARLDPAIALRND